ncbi:MAG: hypothetical protein OHK0039_26190 [Bacteroidia bacterium]
MQDFLDFLNKRVEVRLIVAHEQLHPFADVHASRRPYHLLEGNLYPPEGEQACNGIFRIGSQVLNYRGGTYTAPPCLACGA